jgi:hypothetical protein
MKKQPFSKAKMSFLALSLWAASVQGQVSVQNEFSEHQSAVGFTENKGQILDEKGDVILEPLFQTSADNSTVFLTSDAVSYVFSQLEPVNFLNPALSASDIIERVDMKFLNTNPAVQIIPSNQLPGISNYFRDVYPSGIPDVRSFATVTYKNLYNGIDMVITNNGASPVYQFIIAAGADPGDIQFTFEGAQSVSLNNDGTLRVTSTIGSIDLAIPTGLQNILGSEVPIVTGYVQSNQVIQLSAERVSATNTTVVQFKGARTPVLHCDICPTNTTSWVTYYGGTAGNGQGMNDAIKDSYTDAAGNLYQTGITRATNFPPPPVPFKAAGHRILTTTTCSC